MIVKSPNTRWFLRRCYRHCAVWLMLGCAQLAWVPSLAQTTPTQSPQSNGAQSNGVRQTPYRQAPSATARDGLRQALLVYEQSISLSNLDYWWKTHAMAQICRSLARFGDTEQVRTMAQNLLANAENAAAQGAKAPPPAFGKISYYAIMAEAFADIGDGETANSMVTLSARELAQNGDRALQASFYPFLARVLIMLQRPTDAKKYLDDAAGKIAAIASDRERVAVGFALVNGYVRLGDMANATRHQAQAAQVLNAMSPGLDRALAEAFLARGAAMLRQLPEARNYALASSRDFNTAAQSSQNPGQNTEILQIKSLAALALAWREMGDGNGARQTLTIMRRVVGQIQSPYERFLGWIALTDTIVQVEQPSLN